MLNFSESRENNVTSRVTYLIFERYIPSLSNVVQTLLAPIRIPLLYFFLRFLISESEIFVGDPLHFLFGGGRYEVQVLLTAGPTQGHRCDFYKKRFSSRIIREFRLFSTTRVSFVIMSPNRGLPPQCSNQGFPAMFLVVSSYPIGF